MYIHYIFRVYTMNILEIFIVYPRYIIIKKGTEQTHEVLTRYIPDISIRTAYTCNIPCIYHVYTIYILCIYHSYANAPKCLIHVDSTPRWHGILTVQVTRIGPTSRTRLPAAPHLRKATKAGPARPAWALSCVWNLVRVYRIT